MEENEVAPSASVEERMAKFFGAPEANAEADEAAPAEAAPEEAVDTETTEVVEGEQEPDQPAEAEPDGTLVEVEFEGKQLKVAPEIKDALMRHTDYTRKTMAHADQVRIFQQQQQVAGLEAAFATESEPEQKSLNQLEAQIEQFKALNWAEMDTDQIVRARQALDAIKEKRDETKNAIEGKRKDFTAKIGKAREQLLQQGGEYLRKVIPVWGEVSQKDSAQAALSVGFTRSEVEQFMDPRAVHLAWKAAQWDKLQESRPSTANKVKTVPPMSKPGSAASTESTASKRYMDARTNLKKTGSVEAAVATLLSRPQKR